MARSTFKGVCSECGASLAKKRPGSKTCGDTCRAARSRRLKRHHAPGGRASASPEHAAAIADIVRLETPDIAHKVIERELAPIVREAITEEVLRSIRDMVGLTPRVVQLIAADLESADDVVRQKAYTLITKYTLGHPALVQPEDKGGGQQLVINFAMPRPGDEAQGQGAAEEIVDADAVAECDTCHESKPESEFVAGSSRCRSCFDQGREKAKALLAGEPAAA